MFTSRSGQKPPLKLSVKTSLNCGSGGTVAVQVRVTVGVFVGSGVAVGTGVSVGIGVFVGSGVLVGGSTSCVGLGWTGAATGVDAAGAFWVSSATMV